MSDFGTQVSPAAVHEQLAAAVPEDCNENLVIVGSLRAIDSLEISHICSSKRRTLTVC